MHTWCADIQTSFGRSIDCGRKKRNHYKEITSWHSVRRVRSNVRRLDDASSTISHRIIDVEWAHHTIRWCDSNPFHLATENRLLFVRCWKDTGVFCFQCWWCCYCCTAVPRSLFHIMYVTIRSEHFWYANIISGTQLFQTNPKSPQKNELSIEQRDRVNTR